MFGRHLLNEPVEYMPCSLKSGVYVCVCLLSRNDAKHEYALASKGRLVSATCVPWLNR